MAESNIFSNFKHIKAFVLDVDGVLTDGGVLVTESGEQLRQMNIKDGLAIHIAVNKGYKIIVISGGKSQGVVKRLQGLGVEDVHIGIKDKLTTLKDIMKNHNLLPEHCLAMGDDLPDLPILSHCGIAACPSDAAREVLGFATFVSKYEGGKACVRDVIEKVLRIRGDWPDPFTESNLVAK